MRFAVMMALALAAAVGFSNCAWFEKKPSPLAGQWRNPLGTVWILNDEGTFEVDLDHDSKRDAWGKYSLNQDDTSMASTGAPIYKGEISIQPTGGLMPKGCDGRGVYQFTRNGDDLQFKLLSDRCKLRKKNLRLPWTLSTAND